MAELVLEHEARQKLVILAGLVLAGMGFVLLAMAIAGQNLFLLTALAALVGFVVIFPFPKLAILLVILFAQIQYLFTTFDNALIPRPIFPVAFQWLDEVILLAILINLGLTKLLKREALHKAPALMLVAALFMLGLISARLNGLSAREGLLGLRYLFEMVIIYLAVINMDLDERFLRGIISLLLAIGVFQAAVGFLEFASKYRLYLSGNHDIVQGTWGGGSSNHIGIFFLSLAAIVLAGLRRGWDGRKAVLFGIYIVLVVFCSCRTGIVLAPFMILFVLREKLKNPRYWIAAAIALVFLMGSLAAYYSNTAAEVSTDLGTGEFIFQVTGRTGVVGTMSQVLRENSRFPPFGTGPGTYLSPTGGHYGSTMFIQVESMLRTREVILPFISASYAVVWMEYGLAGLILFGVVLLRLFMFAWRQEKAVASPFWKDYFRGLQAIIAIYVLGGGIFALWTHFQTNIYLWLFPAIGVRYVILERQKASRTSRVAAPQSETAPRPLPDSARSDSLAN